ncbi:hypothetical protein MH117_02380 [Paenibacillus sp. ACRRX]|uniref:hypothetical protein n=1 Tax=unclassified Paenibacillus TaxID=185978 RepID=UPI001EF5FDC5|nr:MULTISPECIES: hypothetical protein [unclassified Paenibacillus]MCG7406247.1 hypothetical protein [Paenibacillus sp. ACRRX]MDK8179280.1 hypothetical protein [Paenibacillus sp. UMB4589-SE434]
MNSSKLALRYVEWDEEAQLERGELSNWSVSRDYLFICKLADATVLRNRLWEHTSHETDQYGQAIIYVRAYKGQLAPDVANAVKHTIFHTKCDVADPFEMVWYVYDRVQNTFQHAGTERPSEPLQAALVMLDHYMYWQNMEVESLMTVLDADRNKLLLFVERLN